MSDDSLYERDFVRWSAEQGAELRQLARAGYNGPLDLPNIAEGIESLGRSDRQSLASHIRRILEHMMKLDTSAAVDPRQDWLDSIERARTEIEALLEESP